jgi:anti-sigma28 factor (negative regulator of flagellin synthesis)
MFHFLTAVLILGPRGDQDTLRDVVGLDREPDIWTIRQEVIMTTIATVVELQPADRRKAQDARNRQGRDTPRNGDMLMERILGNMNATPQEGVLKEIASLPDIRRGKVLRLRRQIADGAYSVANRLDKAMDHILRAITA